MTDDALQFLFSDLLNTMAPNKNYRISTIFYKTKSLRHTIQLKRKYIQIRIAEPLRQAPEHILRSLGIILYSKLFRFKIDSNLRRKYRHFVEDSILPIHPSTTRKPSSKYKAQGNIYNLELIFDYVNRAYFHNKLQKPILGWSLKKGYTRLGFFAEDKNLLVISRIFDTSRVPLKVVEYMMYHEMLHIAIPTKVIDGRRKIHPPDFKKMDRTFPDYDEIQKWIKKNRARL